MGEEVRGVPEAAALSDGEGDAGTSSIGRYLARQRVLRGISLEELAVATRIPQRSLERLEQGAFDRAPDGFARGFVRTVATALGLDPDEAVLRLMSEPPGEDADEGSAGLGWLLRPAFWGGLLAAAVLCAAALLLAKAIGGPDAPPPDPESEIVRRRDPVRELVEGQGPPPAPGPAPGERREAPAASRAAPAPPPAGSAEAPASQ